MKTYALFLFRLFMSFWACLQTMAFTNILISDMEEASLGIKLLFFFVGIFVSIIFVAFIMKIKPKSK